MGYDLHITRAEDWSQSEQRPITLDEWLAYVENDPELRRDMGNPEMQIYIWNGPSEYPDPWVCWEDGEINTKNPDKPLIIKMTQIAAALGARVCGDDGEIYGTDGQPISKVEPSPKPLIPNKPWWRRFLGL